MLRAIVRFPDLVKGRKVFGKFLEDGDSGLGREPQSGPRAAEAPARHARGAPARRRGGE